MKSESALRSFLLTTTLAVIHRPLVLACCLSSLLAPLQAAEITFVGHQDGVEDDADTPTSGWRNASPAKPLDIDLDKILGTDGYEVAGKVSNPSYAWITNLAPNRNGGPWGLWDDPANPSGNDTLAATIYHDSTRDTVDAFEIVIHGNALAGKTLRVGILYGVITLDTGTISTEVTFADWISGFTGLGGQTGFT